MNPAALAGFLARRTDAASPGDRPAAGATRVRCGAVTMDHWGLRAASEQWPVFVVSRVHRRAGGSVDEGEIAALLRTDPGSLAGLLPPFGAVGAEPGGVSMVADSLGFQHLFHSAPCRAEGPVMSSSALHAGWAASAPLDRTAIGVQSLLGWQLGQRTLFEGIRKLEPGASARLDAAGVHVRRSREPAGDPIDMDDAVRRAADVLRVSLNALLDDHPDAVLQLTGGMDSRLLLSAIPARRRRGLRAMTLEVPGSGDVARARVIAERYGIRHTVHGLADVGTVSPAVAWELCRADAIRLDAMADPVALAAQRIAERDFDQGVRISGLGGEMARGFYYVGRIRDRAYSRGDAEELASWRMFVNEAVEPGLLTHEFSAWARAVANDEVYAALEAGGEEWFRAADELYAGNRMQRWAGATDIAVSDQRTIVNPMLDAAFLDIAARLRPQDKAHARFLGALQMELDPELGVMPLDGRPAPSTYADPGAWQPVLDVARTGRRAARKAVQRLRRGNRPPAGGTILAAKVVAHWRQHPEILRPLGDLDFVRGDWVQDVLNARVDPRPSSVAFVTNLVVASSSEPASLSSAQGSLRVG
ncbi:asparagine synthase-related protein [Microbacterium pygmaeum]|uniref:Asparagine synthase (Glutamine-hydrolysing) n=1 Tax=Microbacterium pygmaeum TaxID=370764 RepID=A0A1G8DTY6_9MICO|nr:asparagine synthase-related protein [Microbacterium pygmaeum]SDH61127.1 asparagine synthase (glutamine-hydrolysing) [Microbacterium pygmaeum]